MRLRPVFALLAMLAATVAAMPVAAADNPPAATPADTVQVINTALVKVDTDALDKLLRQNDPLTRVLAAMALDRVHGRLAQSSTEAATCKNGLINNQPQVALYCALFALGNLRLSGQDHAASTAMQQLPQQFQGKLPAAQWDQLNHFVALQTGQAVTEAELPSTGFDIPVHAGRHHGGRESDDGTIDAQINGKPVALRVGTSSAYVVLDQDTAQGLGIQVAAESADKDHPASPTFATLDSLSFAGATFRHVPVQVVPGAHIHAIGMGLFKYLRTFRMARDNIQIYGPTDARPACDDAMLLASDAGGSTGLRLAVQLGIDDAQSVAMLSLDSPFYLYGNKDAPAAPSHGGGHRMGGMGGMGGGGMGSMGGGRGGSARSTLEVTLDGKTLRMPYVAARSPNLPWDYALGHAMLDDMDLYVDFNSQHTCLLKH
ncbi:retropepsin-like domain-containing protein [Rhodanobacter sp. 7MK24]|uniref:aspartyl protease family protein n=1 Tax=Rhodanobacter sp. 7MK24 TaxID=2775922 RepID=UPI0017858CC7|nr:retropepsin-like domain-containing protein [Rhodanobacter sp. 7MK24]